MNFTRTTGRTSRTRAVVRMAGLIDLVFLLLAFFLVTTALLDPESSVSTALGTGGETAVLVPPMQVQADRGAWIVGDRRVTSVQALQGMLEALPKGPGLVVTATPEATAGDIVTVVRVARAAGFEALRMQTGP